jgi:hypothetical protein
MNISEIQIGKLYSFPEDDIALFSFNDPIKDRSYSSIDILLKNQLFVVLNVVTVNLSIPKTTLFRINILTPKGVFWLSVQEFELNFIKAMSSYNKKEALNENL